ncbi:LysR family transcriptional regulator [Acidisoma sp. L85]
MSRLLASLEGYLGHLLFERHGRGVVLTDAGK